MSEFLAIPGFEGLYEINAEGTVRSVARTTKAGIPGGTRSIAASEKKVLVDKKTGRRTVQLFKDNKKKNLNVDKLVKELFATKEG